MKIFRPEGDWGGAGFESLAWDTTRDTTRYRCPNVTVGSDLLDMADRASLDGARGRVETLIKDFQTLQGENYKK
jgi:hypothetical protein